VGSRSSEYKAYIAGFLDGDGSVMLQIKKRNDSTLGIRFMATICFYQDTRHEKELNWIKSELGIGYVSRRNDGMSELRINGYKQVHKTLSSLQPFVRFKRIQVVKLIQACEILMASPFKKLSERQKRILVDCIVAIQNENYVTKKKRSKEELLTHLGLTP
jgi:hypothetical protein